jgi:hypothetical protein
MAGVSFIGVDPPVSFGGVLFVVGSKATSVDAFCAAKNQPFGFCLFRDTGRNCFPDEPDEFILALWGVET